MDEPSVLDYLKARLSFGRTPAPEIPALPAEGHAVPARKPAGKAAKKPAKTQAGEAVVPWALAWPWRALSAFVLLLIAQALWNRGAGLLGSVPALIGLGMALWAARHSEWRLPTAAAVETGEGVFLIRRVPLILGLTFFALAFITSSGNRFGFWNLSFWLASMVLTMGAFWQFGGGIRQHWTAAGQFFSRENWTLSLSRWGLLLITVVAVVALFRFSDLAGTPPEMLSDHAEKLLDVYDIQQGQSSIFFPRITGREPLQFYWTALIAGWFGTGLSFLSLKLGTVLLSFFSLGYMYLLGKELGGRWVGLLALLLMGVAYWPNVLARTGLRFSLYAAFAAPALYFLLLALRKGRVNHFLLAGLFLGAGLYGYTSFRIMPFVAAALLLVYVLHRPPADQRNRALIGFALAALVVLVVFTPLLRYSLEEPATFTFRMNSRLLPIERDYPGSPVVIFLGNVWNALRMVNYDAGNIWLVGLLGEPALDLVSAALFLLGIALLGVRYARTRDWRDLFLLLAVPLLMLPSILSIAYPDENPALNRAGGAAIAVFLICAIALDSLLHGLRDKIGGNLGRWMAGIGGLFLVLIIALSNYGLVFIEYREAYRSFAWNSAEMGQVVADYAGSFGSLDSAWVVAYPHWVDTRLVAINAGFPGHDYGIWPDQLVNTLSEPAPKLFLVKPEDEQGQQTLRDLYPQGVLTLFMSNSPTRDFLIYLVPAEGP
jgi:hypothetical protein